MGYVVLSQATRTRTQSIAELANPAPIVLAIIKVILIVAHEACIAELPIAAIVWHFRELKVSLNVYIRKLFSVYLQ